MAGVSCTITRQYRRYVQTNRGPLWFSVIEVEEAYSSNNTYYMGHYYSTTGSSIISNVHKNELTSAWESVQTPFQSVDGRLVGTAFGSGQNSGIVVTLDGVEIHRSGTPWVDTIWVADVGGSVVVFSDGYFGIVRGRAFITKDFWRSQYPNDIDCHPTIYWNGPNSFGNWTDTEKDNGNVWVVNGDNATYQIASYLMGVSREYGDPYDGGGEDNPEGETDDGPGTWELPTDELANGGTVYSDLTAGLYRAYAMTASQLLAFSNQLWEVNVLRDLRELIEKPAEIALGLFSYPFDVNSESSAVQIGFNWLSHWSPTNVYGYPINSEIMYLDFGDIVIDRYSGCFYDYQPFSIIQLHLPYIGFVPLKMSECTGRTLHISYCVDVLNGDFTAHVTSSGYEEHYGVQLLGTYQGNIGKPLPLSQQSIFELVKRGAEIGTAALSMAGAVFMGGGAAIAALDTANRIQEMSSGSGEKEAMESAQKLLQHQEASLNRSYQTFRRAGHSIVNNIGNLGEGAGAISRSGSVDGSVGRTSPQQCFAIIQYPDQSRPSNQEILGYPSNIPGPLSKVRGYTEVREIRLHAGIATEGEMAEIEEIVRGGIII